jgi:hypothetical protein
MVGWAVADHMREDLVIDALSMAVANRRPATGEVIFHSDYAEVDVKPENLRMACSAVPAARFPGLTIAVVVRRIPCVCGRRRRWI